MVLKVADRGRIPSFIVMDVLRAANERAAAGGDVLHLEMGQPGTPAPNRVREAAKRALDADRLGYTDAFGIPELRACIAKSYALDHGLSIDPARIAVTPGSSGGFILAFLAAFAPGDRVALAEPGYPAYRNILKALDVEVVGLPVGAETHYQPTPELLDARQSETGKSLDGLIIASPANPTGCMIGKDDLQALVGYCADNGIRLVSDEIYHGITFIGAAHSALRETDDAIIVNSFSKYFSMTGWRLGWLVLPEDLTRPVECLAQSLFISSASLSQYAGIAAFDCRDELDALVAGYARNREVLLRELPKAGFRDLAPADGAFYIYADISGLTNDSVDFCKRMLAEIGVATTPGLDFDPERGHRTMRLSFAGQNAEIVEAMERLKTWLD